MMTANETNATHSPMRLSSTVSLNRPTMLKKFLNTVFIGLCVLNDDFSLFKVCVCLSGRSAYSVRRHSDGLVRAACTMRQTMVAPATASTNATAATNIQADRLMRSA